MNLIITDHAEDRFRERVGLPKRLVTKNAKKALELGVTHADATGRLKRYFDHLYMVEQQANNVRIYCGTVYVFSFDTLITVFPVPPELRKCAAKAQQKKKQQQTQQVIPESPCCAT